MFAVINDRYADFAVINFKAKKRAEKSFIGVKRESAVNKLIQIEINYQSIDLIATCEAASVRLYTLKPACFYV